MKIQLVIFFLFTFGISSFSQDNKKIVILKSVLGIKEVSDILALNYTSDNGSVRIVDLSNKFKNCKFDYTEIKGFRTGYLNVIVANKFPMDFNLGYNRDLIIYSFHKRKKSQVLDVYLSNYKCHGSQKNRIHMTISMSNENGTTKIDNVKIGIWD